MSATTLERVRRALAGLEFEELAARDGMPTLGLAPEDVHAAMERLAHAGRFSTCILVTAVDHLPDEPRFEVVWQLLSVAENDRVRVKCRLPGDEPRVASVSDLWPGARFSERECWDMFGIRFDGLADHRRLLMPEEYGHHPLRKDFPHQGIDPGRLYREWDRARRAQQGFPAQHPDELQPQR